MTPYAHAQRWRKGGTHAREHTHMQTASKRRRKGLGRRDRQGASRNGTSRYKRVSTIYTERDMQRRGRVSWRHTHTRAPAYKDRINEDVGFLFGEGGVERARSDVEWRFRAGPGQYRCGAHARRG